MAITAVKVCACCDEEKSSESFSRDRGTSSGLAAYCRECRAAKSKGYYARWTDAERVKHRARVLRSRYGISPEMLAAMYESQEGCCTICGVWKEKPAQAGKRSNRDTLHVDHDHATGVVRGLICVGCNLILGYAKDNEDVLLRAVLYLREGRR